MKGICLLLGVIFVSTLQTAAGSEDPILYLELNATLSSEDNKQKPLRINKEARLDLFELVRWMEIDADHLEGHFEVELPEDKDELQEPGESFIRLFFKDAKVSESETSWEFRGGSSGQSGGKGSASYKYAITYSVDVEFSEAQQDIRLQADLWGVAALYSVWGRPLKDVTMFGASFYVEDTQADITLKVHQEDKQVVYSGEGVLRIWSGCKILEEEYEKLQDAICLYFQLKATLSSKDNKKGIDIKRETKITIPELLKLIDVDVDEFSIELPEEDRDEEESKQLIKLFFKDAKVNEGDLSLECGGGSMSREYNWEMEYNLTFSFRAQGGTVEIGADLLGNLHIGELYDEEELHMFVCDMFGLLDREADVVLKVQEGGRQVTYSGEGCLMIQAGKMILEEQD